jgi:hypothetical protein
MRKVLTGAVFAALLATGAAADDDTPPPMTVMPASETCAPSPELSGAIAVNPDDDAKAVMDTTAARCVRDASGAGLYQVFALPAVVKPSILTVASVPVGTAIVFPRITLLDASGKITRQVAPDALQFRAGELTAVLRLHAGDAYLVVQSDPAHAGQSFSRVQESVHVFAASVVARAFIATAVIHTGSDDTNTLTFSLSGKVQVSVEHIATSN